jgi:hypothetical protein
MSKLPTTATVTGNVNAALAADRARIDAIVNSQEGLSRPKAALQLALRSSMGVNEAREFLALGPSESPYFESAMANESINLGGQSVGKSVGGDARAARLAEISVSMKHFNSTRGHSVN